ncbi:ComEC/Rec2 family competence protein [Maribellus mangrovi]|uniref:ComEC/Rec2 family competence protein n=1 Tax=Maribellus mangrovi TaxID=3133146 RepID=UPI0030EB4F48
MKNLFQNIPSLRLIIAVAVGFLIAEKIIVPVPVLLIVSMLLLAGLLILNRNYRFHLEAFFGSLVFLLFILVGSMYFNVYNSTPRFFDEGMFWGTILEVPEEKSNSYKSLVQLNAVKDSEKVWQCNEKLLVYFEKDSTAMNLKPGNTILFSGNPEMVKNNGNPYEFDYRKYLSRKKIYRSVYLTKSDWTLSTRQKQSFKTVAENVRERLLRIYRSYHLGTKETEILSALTLGYKRGLDPETKRTFSSAGAMHVLAVSGLHVGIIFGIFALFFGFLKNQKRGKILYVLLAVGTLWAYAFITGLSPSVMRAAAMFSLVCIASAIQRRTNIYNTLTASAMLLLLINPNNLFEVGFQLSYTAVFGIVYLQPKLYGLWPAKNKVAKFFWTLLTVSVAAQIATFPLSAYYFNQFPTYFWLSNLLVIPAVIVLISLGMALLIFSAFPILATWLAVVTGWAVKFVYIFLAWIENLPFAVQNINLTKMALYCVIAVLLFSFLFMEQKRMRYIKFVLSALIILAGSNLTLKLQQQNKSELIVYNNSRNLVIQLISGSKNYVISEAPLDSTDFILRAIHNVELRQRLATAEYYTFHENYTDELLFLQKEFIRFGDKNIWIDCSQSNRPKFINPDFIISASNTLADLPEFPSTSLISNAYTKKSNNPNVHFLRYEGAYKQQWKTKQAVN